jgi:DNA-3-methyladenine glycosylase I
MNRCRWVNINNPKYVDYHDNEWGRVKNNDRELFEMLVLEGFQAGLSWECVLNKRDSFREACDNFDYNIIVNYNEDKIEELLKNNNIIRSRRKIEAMINNAKIFIEIRREWGSFYKYIWHFTNNKIIKNKNDIFVSSNKLSDTISKDLKKRGMKYVGSIIIYSYLESIGVMDNHELKCCRY